MEFWVKLIQLIQPAPSYAADAFEINCTHVARDLYLFEGEVDALIEDGIKFIILDEQAIQGTGDLSQAEIIKMVKDLYVFDHNLITI